VSLEMHRASLRFPAIEQHGLADQVRRASKSICGNIAEGFGKQRRSSAEFKRYLLMAIGSADEMQVWLRYCADLDYVDQEEIAAWRDEYRQIAKMLQGLYTAWSAPH
jgi:four helix bundle protein